MMGVIVFGIMVLIVVMVYVFYYLLYQYLLELFKLESWFLSGLEWVWIILIILVGLLIVVIVVINLLCCIFVLLNLVMDSICCVVCGDFGVCVVVGDCLLKEVVLFVDNFNVFVSELQCVIDE